jgi:molybdopterin molybdotransferase
MKAATTSIADVRMHGFRQRSEVSAVLDWIDQHATPLGTESIPLEVACGRTLAAEVIAPLDVPGFDRAAMDGFALRGAETAGASEYNPLEFRVFGQAMPGQPFVGTLSPG